MCVGKWSRRACSAPRPSSRYVTWGFVSGSGGFSVVVDRSAEDSVSADLAVERDGGVVVGRALLAALVWQPVIVEVSGVAGADDESLAPGTVGRVLLPDDGAGCSHRAASAGRRRPRRRGQAVGGTRAISARSMPRQPSCDTGDLTSYVSTAGRVSVCCPRVLVVWGTDRRVKALAGHGPGARQRGGSGQASWCWLTNRRRPHDRVLPLRVTRAAAELVRARPAGRRAAHGWSRSREPPGRR
jgi:hypothetical protein